MQTIPQVRFVDDILVAPILEYGSRKHAVYLPENSKWIDIKTGNQIEGGKWINADAPLESIPVFIKTSNTSICEYFN